MITITTTIIVQVFLFLTLPFHRLRISPLSAGKTRWEPKGKKVPRWPASSTDQAPLLFTVESENSASSQSAVWSSEVLLLSEEGGSSEAKRKCVLLYFYCDSIHCPPPHLGRGKVQSRAKYGFCNLEEWWQTFFHGRFLLRRLSLEIQD